MLAKILDHVADWSYTFGGMSTVGLGVIELETDHFVLNNIVAIPHGTESILRLQSSPPSFDCRILIVRYKASVTIDGDL